MATHLFSVAPMMEWTDRHCRYFHRLLAPDVLLYTEMVTAPAILHGDQERLLGYSAQEHPIALQLGGSEPEDLAKACAIGAKFGYDEINLNCGCPSDRVQKGAFGACLMAEPTLVAACVRAMREASGVPVSVKCRIGIDDMDAHDCLWRFIEQVEKAGCQHFVVHARKAWLKGLSPKENREVPPLEYELVKQLKKEFKHLNIALNGGIQAVEQVRTYLKTFDSVMIGRAAYHNPQILADIQHELYGTPHIPLASITQKMAEYATNQRARYGTPLGAITRHMLGLNAGKRGARRWRQILGEDARAPDADIHNIFNTALKAIQG